MSEQQQVAPRRGLEGGRWLNERPTQEELIAWFESSMKLDPALKHEDYVGGLVLIPTVDEKSRYVSGYSDKGEAIIDTRPELVFTPYARVETRVAYFWDLMDAHREWVAVVEQVPSSRMPIDFVTEEEVREGQQVRIQRRQPGAMSVLVHQLPEGFSIMSVPVGQGYSHFLCSTTRVSIYRCDRNGEPEGRPLRTGRGTKQVPLLLGRNQPYADANSLMRAETGSMGRALGFAGIFVISGVATAEDVLEALSQGATPAQAAPDAGNQGPASPDAAPVRTGAEQAQETEDQMRVRAVALWKALSDESPAKAEEFGAWMKQRRLNRISDAQGAALRGMVRKLEKLTEEANQSAQQMPISEGNGDVSSQAPQAEPSAAAE